MNIRDLQRSTSITFYSLLLAAGASNCALAAMPWEQPICMVAASPKGQVAVVLAVVATIIIGIMFMYSESGGMVARIGGWLLGMSLALAVVSVINTLFPGVSVPGCL